jgi:hypothetical protein
MQRLALRFGSVKVGSDFIEYVDMIQLTQKVGSRSKNCAIVTVIYTCTCCILCTSTECEGYNYLLSFEKNPFLGGFPDLTDFSSWIPQVRACSLLLNVSIW